MGKHIETMKAEKENLLTANNSIVEKLRQVELELKLEKDKSISLFNEIQLIKKLEQDKKVMEKKQLREKPGTMQSGENMNHIDNYEADGDLMKALSKITGLSVPNKMTP